MKCHLVEQNVDDYLKGSLPEELVIDAEMHLDTCELCSSRLLDQDPQLDAMLYLDWYAEDSPEGFAGRVMHKIEGVSSPRRFMWVAPVWLAFTAYWGAIVIWIVLARRFFGLTLGGVVGTVRTIQSVIGTVVEALSMFHINEFGLFIICALLSLCLAGIGFISREVLQ